MRVLALIATAMVVACSGGSSGSSPAGGGAVGGGGSGQGGQGANDQGGAEPGTGGAGLGGGPDCVDELATLVELPQMLSETGLYQDIGTQTPAENVRDFEPRFSLWSDGAAKSRWVYLPECGVIDTSDMNDWSLPVGSRLWKEFRVGAVQIETRIIARVGPGPHDFLYGSYIWLPDGSDATLVLDGVPNAKGTSHDIPAETTCRRCHGSHEKGGGRPSRALGFSAYQLSVSDGALTLESLAEGGRLSHLPASGGYPAVGGNTDEQQALGLLHVNCGTCHNGSVDGVPQVDLNLWIDVEMETPAQTGAYLTAIGVPNQIFADQQITARIEPGSAAASSVWFRMSQRDNNAQMPPVGSEQTDDVGLGVVQAWIEALP